MNQIAEIDKKITAMKTEVLNKFDVKMDNVISYPVLDNLNKGFEIVRIITENSGIFIDQNITNDLGGIVSGTYELKGIWFSRPQVLFGPLIQ